MWKLKWPNSRKDGVSIAALAGYLGIFFVIGLFSENDFARFHAKQGLAVFVCEALFTLLTLIAAAFIGFGSTGHWMLVGGTAIFWLATTILRVTGIANAARGLKTPLFLTGSLAAKL